MPKRTKWKDILISLFGFAFMALFLYGIYKLIALLISSLAGIDPAIAAAIIAGILTIFSTTLTIVLARYFESKREREAVHRDKKIALYDELLKKLFEIFLTPDQQKTFGENLVLFLREIHRKLVLWSGPKVIAAYAEWHEILSSQGDTPKAKSMIKMVDFFLALRRDLGHSNRGIKREHLVRFMLKHPDLFMKMYKENQEVTFSEIAEIEKKLG